MGSNFNLGSIPEDMSMDTADLDTTLTAESNNVVGQTTTTLVGPGAANCTAAVNGNPAPNDQLISSVLPAHAEIPTISARPIHYFRTRTVARCRFCHHIGLLWV